MATDLTSAIVNLKSAETLTQVQYAVAAKILKLAQTQGEAALELIEAASETLEQAAGDVAAASVDLASELDVLA